MSTTTMDCGEEESTIMLSPSTPPSTSRHVRWVAIGTLVMCALSLGLLASISTTSMGWKATTALRQSVQFLQQSSTIPTIPVTFVHQNDTSKGIILCLHDGIASMGASLIRELRCLGNTDVIQVYHCFSELSPASRALLTRHDDHVELIDVCTELLDDDKTFIGNKELAETFRSYWIKPLALYHTRLEEVILLDADALVLQDPANLRHSSTGYNRTGTIFFHDRITFMRKFFNKKMSNGKQMLHHILDTFNYTRFGMERPSAPSKTMQETFAYKEETGHEMDSSMVFVDKRRSGKAMDVLLYLIFELRFQMTFSWGDKEAFWLAYELAQQEYFFSPWGLSLIDSVPNDDLKEHPDTLCGSMAHFFPTEDESDTPEVLYVNGKVLLDPFAVGIAKLGDVQHSRLFNSNPTRVTPRYKYSEFDLSSRKTFECMDDLGSTPLPESFRNHLLRRRYHYFAAETGVLDALDRCDV